MTRTAEDGELHSVLCHPAHGPAQGVTAMVETQQGPNKQTVEDSGAGVPSAGFKHQATPCKPDPVSGASDVSSPGLNLPGQRGCL